VHAQVKDCILALSEITQELHGQEATVHWLSITDNSSSSWSHCLSAEGC